MVIRRTIEKQLAAEFARQEISILLGPRQVGKTFLINILEKRAKTKKLRIRSFNLEIPADLIQFNKSEIELFRKLTTDIDVLFIDEFHYLNNASKLFKAIYDSNKGIKIFASGSSSLEIHKHLKESLAGRRLTSHIFPLSYEEFLQTELKNGFEQYLLYGGLPGLINTPSAAQKIRLLNEILETYIQKDVKSLIKEENIRAFNTLLYLIAENQGSVQAISNLSREVGLTASTVSNHLSILEQTYVVFPLHSYSKNMGNELKKSKKYYLFDTGIRNAMLKDFGGLRQRTDLGILYESFVFNQLKTQLRPNMELKFWRTKQGQEIDFILLKNRKPFLVEVKTTWQGPVIPAAFTTFIKRYPETAGGIVLSDNLEVEREYLGKKILFRKLGYITEFIRNYFD